MANPKSWRVKIKAQDARKIKVFQKDPGTGHWLVVKNLTLLGPLGDWTAKVKTRLSFGGAVADSPAKLKLRIWWPSVAHPLNPFFDREINYRINVSGGSRTQWARAKYIRLTRDSETDQTQVAVTTPSAGTTSETIAPQIVLTGMVSMSPQPIGPHQPLSKPRLWDAASLKSDLLASAIPFPTPPPAPPEEDEVDVLLEESVEDTVVEVFNEDGTPADGQEHTESEHAALTDRQEPETSAEIPAAVYLGGGAALGAIGASMVQGNRVAGGAAGAALGYLASMWMAPKE